MSLLWNLWLVVLCVAPLASGFRNPIIPGFNPDPTILAVGDDYFISTSTFEFFPGHPIYHSKDLINWKLIGHALNRPSQIQLYGVAPEGGIWAPTLRYYDGTYYLLTANRRVYTGELKQFSRGYYVHTKDIFSNNWSDPVYLDTLGYDTDLFIDDDKTAWITECGINNQTGKIYGIYQHKIDIKTGRSLSPNTLIFNGTLPLNAAARPEGPHLYKKDKYYYLLIAEGGTFVTHQATISRGPTPSGPWESYPANPIVYNGVNTDVSQQPVQNTGHCDIIKTKNGTWWGVCLGIRPQGLDPARAQLGRETFLLPVTWDESTKWPVFNNNKSISLVGPGLYNTTLNSTSYYDDFSKPTLDLGYYFLRTPYSTFWELGKKVLTLFGTPISMGDRDTPSLLLRKQTAFNQLFTTELDFAPSVYTEEAGITIFYSDFYHSDIGVSLCPPDVPSYFLPSTPTLYLSAPRCVFFRSIVANNGTGASVANLNATVISTSYFPIQHEGSVKLGIQGENVRYSFGWGASGSSNLTWVGAIDSIWAYSAPPGYLVFKGAHFGMFSQGKEQSVFNAPAKFKYWSQQTTAYDF